ncbi:hypothetical protein GBAR_LOCUS20321 [Geodia barretti]|uniref:Uncharacterized protein n=1 Tax=Geodia barretti TaxID=519541 RepID=A0AA35SUQ7_GEOBA|nr:hypothetical protein GBAR_LOCUS20321 [Geodia barretti]
MKIPCVCGLSDQGVECKGNESKLSHVEHRDVERAPMRP